MPKYKVEWYIDIPGMDGLREIEIEAKDEEMAIGEAWQLLTAHITIGEVNERQEIAEHILLHLQSIRKGLSILEAGQVMPDTRLQLEFDLYEIGEHLGFSPAQVNNDKVKHI